MTTTVVNLKKESYDTYVGRAGHDQDGFFGSPVAVGKKCPECGISHFTPSATIPCFKRYFLSRVERDPRFRERVMALKDKRLGCFCSRHWDLDGNPMCHGVVIAQWLDRHDVEEDEEDEE